MIRKRKLTYERYRGSNNMLTIDLQNRYTVLVIKLNSKPIDEEFNTYLVELRLKENMTDDWKIIEKAESLEFTANAKTINSAILKQVSQFLEEGFFEYYIKRYEYEMKCFDKGNTLFENGRNGKNNYRSCLHCPLLSDGDDGK